MPIDPNALESVRRKLETLDLTDDEREVLYAAYTLDGDEVSGYAKLDGFALLPRPSRPGQRSEPETCTGGKTFAASLESETGDE